MKTLMGEQKTTIRAICLRCGETTVIKANVSDVVAWQNECKSNQYGEDGELIQDFLGYLSKAERDLLISKTCKKCFDKWN